MGSQFVVSWPMLHEYILLTCMQIALLSPPCNCFLTLHLFCRVDDGIGHFRFTEELDGQIIAGTTKFDNMIALIDYYRNNPIRLQTKLTHAVNEKILLEIVS